MREVPGAKVTWTFGSASYIKPGRGHATIILVCQVHAVETSIVDKGRSSTVFNLANVVMGNIGDEVGMSEVRIANFFMAVSYFCKDGEQARFGLGKGRRRERRMNQFKSPSGPPDRQPTATDRLPNGFLGLIVSP